MLQPSIASDMGVTGLMAGTESDVIVPGDAVVLDGDGIKELSRSSTFSANSVCFSDEC